MRAKEFLPEVAPFIAALGGALTRGAAAAGTALAKGAASTVGKVAQGAATQVGKQLGGAIAGKVGTQGTVGTAGSTPVPEKDKPIAPPVPTNIPTGTKIEPVMSTPGSNPNELQVKIGDAVFSLDTKDPKNTQALKQLNQLAPKQS